MPFSKEADGLFGDCVEEGKAFRLLGVRPGGIRATKFGDTETVHLLVECPSGPRWLSIIGEAILNEVKGLKDSDFPTFCVVERKPTKTPGQTVKLLRPAVNTDVAAGIKDPASVNTSTGSGGYGTPPPSRDTGDDTPY